MSYDADALRAFFNAYGEREWDRLDKTLPGRVKLAVHRKVLSEHVRPGMRVLDVGSGPGRFAIEIARMGATVTLVDLSDVQLDLARARIVEQGESERVDGFHRLDVLDLSTLEANAYDAVVCFGGAISYTTRHYQDAIAQLARVARPGAPVLVSVMSLLGALRLIGPLDAASFLETRDDHLDWKTVLAGADVVLTNPTSNEFHRPMALFTSRGLRDALTVAGLEVELIGTSDVFVPEYSQIPRLSASSRAAETLIELEVAMYDQPGLVDAGGHLIGVARKR